MTFAEDYLLPDFSHIDYLAQGSAVQQQVFHILHSKKILYHLRSIAPVVAGTLPLDLFVPGKSDVDILGQSDNFSETQAMFQEFSTYGNFLLEEKTLRGIESLICRFEIDGLPFEIFVQPMPVQRQYGFRHLLIEYWLLHVFNNKKLHEQVLNLKRSGLKTEPAFAAALGLQGDPYERLLDFEEDEAFKKFIGATP